MTSTAFECLAASRSILKIHDARAWTAECEQFHSTAQSEEMFYKLTVFETRGAYPNFVHILYSYFSSALCLVVIGGLNRYGSWLVSSFLRIHRRFPVVAE